MTEFYCGLIIGIIIGFGIFQIILQFAYRRGIVEYKGISKS